MEVGPHQDPSCFQCMFSRFRIAITNIRSQNELAINTHTMVSDIHRAIVQGQEGSGGKHPPVGYSWTLAITEQTLIVP